MTFQQQNLCFALGVLVLISTFVYFAISAAIVNATDKATRSINKSAPQLTKEGRILFIELNEKQVFEDMKAYLLINGQDEPKSMEAAIDAIRNLTPKYHYFDKQDRKWGFWKIDTNFTAKK